MPVITALLCALGVLSCSSLAISKDAETERPITWDAGFIMPDLLASAVEINQLSDLSLLLTIPWYAEIAVIQTGVGDLNFSSCKDYFEGSTPLTRTKKDNEMSAYLEFKIMCEATRILLAAKSSQSTYLPNLILSESLPTLWPKSVALQTSKNESYRNAQDPELKTWADISATIKYDSVSSAKSIYHHDGGYQELDVVGRGDIDHDGIEDVLIVTRDHLEGGNYFNIRLFAFSVNKQNHWHLINEI